MAFENSRLVEWGLFLFSTFITIVTLCNVVEYASIINGPTNANLSDDSAGYWLVVNIILLVIAVIYWLYRVYRWLFSSGVREVINTRVSNYFTKQPYTGIIVTEEEQAAKPELGFAIPVSKTALQGSLSSSTTTKDGNRTQTDSRIIKTIGS
jgi:hypothetical protein